MFQLGLLRWLSGKKKKKKIHLPGQEMQETWVRSLGREHPLEKEMATHSSILAQNIPWTEEPGGLQSMGSQRVKHNWACTIIHGWVCQLYLNKLKYKYVYIVLPTIEGPYCKKEGEMRELLFYTKSLYAFMFKSKHWVTFIQTRV